MSLNILELFPERVQGKPWLNVVIKLCCIIPATLLAGFIRDLGIIIEFSGLMGFILILTPAILLLKAKKECKLAFQTDTSPFATPFSHRAVILSVIVFNVVGFILTVYSLISRLVS